MPQDTSNDHVCGACSLSKEALLYRTALCVWRRVRRPEVSFLTRVLLFCFGPLKDLLAVVTGETLNVHDAAVIKKARGQPRGFRAREM